VFRKFPVQISNMSEKRTQRILVVGAGLAGVTAAAALAERSVLLDVTCHIEVVDSRNDVALATSFANAGRFCPTSLALGSPAQGAGIQRTMIPNWVKTHFMPLPSFDVRGASCVVFIFAVVLPLLILLNLNLTSTCDLNS
jgi:hypothetical protein